MRFLRLLAKSLPAGVSPDRPSEECTLSGHSARVMAAARAALEATGCVQLAAMGLLGPAWLDRFRNVVLLSAALHDLG